MSVKGQDLRVGAADVAEDFVPLYDPRPPRLVVDANGYVWRDYGEYYSMCPVNPDNEPIPQPVTFYYPAKTWQGKPLPKGWRASDHEAWSDHYSGGVIPEGQDLGAGAADVAQAGRAVLVCVKCGCDDINVRWHSHGGRYGEGACGGHAKLVEYGEHMHFVCRTCGYEWTGEPNDAALTTPTAERSAPEEVPS